MLTILVELAWLALLAAALWAPGEVLPRLLGPRCPAAARDIPVQVALGMGVWSLGLFALAAVGVLRPPILMALFWPAAVWGLWRAAAPVAVTRRRPWTSVRRSGVWLLAAVAAAASAIVLALASYPSIGWDDAVYHLRLPALYLAEGGFATPRFSFFAHWPQNLEMLFALAIAVRGFVLAKLLHAGCGVLLGVATYRLARRGAGPAAAVGAALLIAASPLVLEEARVAYVDLAVASLFALAFDATLRAHERQDPRGHLVLAGVLVGLAAGTKLIAWLGAAVLVALWLMRGVRRRLAPRDVFLDCASLLGPAVALAAPWHVKPWLETGNPVYPLLFGLFGGADWSAELAERAERWQRGIGMGRGAADYLLLPWRVFVLGANGYEHFDGALGRHWPAVALLALAAWGQARVRWCLAAAAGWFVLWAMGPQQARFLVPVLPLLAAAGAMTASELADRTGLKGAHGWFAGAAALLAVLALAGPVRDLGDQLQARSRFGPELAAALVSPPWRYLDERTPASAKVLFLNNNRVFPLRREALADSAFEASQIAEWLRPATSVDAMHELLRAEGVTHVLLERVDWGIDWPRALLDLLADPRHAEPVFESAGRRFVVYELYRR